MGVYIKDMEMPKSCPCKLLGIGYDLYCSFTGGIPARVKEYYECCQNDARPSWCHLVPVRQHGRLIDADELHSVLRKRAKEFSNSEYGEGVKCGLADAREYIKIAPTIIQAEEGE